MQIFYDESVTYLCSSGYRLAYKVALLGSKIPHCESRLYSAVGFQD